VAPSSDQWAKDAATKGEIGLERDPICVICVIASATVAVITR